MQTQLYSLLKDTIKIISPLLYTGLGGFISYKSSSLIESRKEKRKQNIEKLNNILIPLCQHIENSINIFENLKFDNKNFKYIIFETKRLLKVENKIYYSKIVAEYLNNFFEEFNTFNLILEKEQKNFKEEYTTYINNLLGTYHPIYFYKIFLTDSFPKELNKMILKKMPLNKKDFIRLSLEIKSINYGSTFSSVQIFSESVEKKKTSMTENKIDSSNNYINGEEYILNNQYLIFINKNLDVKKLANLISENNSKIKFNELFNLLNILKKEIDSEIKKILKS